MSVTSPLVRNETIQMYKRFKCTPMTPSHLEILRQSFANFAPMSHMSRLRILQRIFARAFRSFRRLTGMLDGSLHRRIASAALLANPVDHKAALEESPQTTTRQRHGGESE